MDGVSLSNAQKAAALANSLVFLKKKITAKRKLKNLQKIITIANSMKGRLRFSTFIFSIFSDLAKYTYG
jgi:hypothetical protein